MDGESSGILQAEVVTVSEVNPITTPQDVLLQSKQLRTFGELLTKCLSIELIRHPENEQLLRTFQRQTLKDAALLIQGKLPEDIVELGRMKKREVKA